MAKNKCTCESVSTLYECRWDVRCPVHFPEYQPRPIFASGVGETMRIMEGSPVAMPNQDYEERRV